MLYLKILIVIFIYSINVFSLSANEEVTINTHIEIDRNFIQLGDIFTYSGDYASTNLVNAPTPGQEISLHYDWLMSIAKRYRLYWPTANQYDVVKVKRSGKNITHDDIIHLLMDHYQQTANLNDNQKLSLTLHQRYLDGIWVDNKADISLAIENFQVKHNQRFFEANIILGYVNGRKLRKFIRGSVDILEKIWVPVMNIEREDIIRENDIIPIWQEQHKITGQVLRHKEAIINKQVRRGLQQNKPIQFTDIQNPILIENKQLITVIYKHQNIRLTIVAQSLDKGSKGDIIRIMNLDSKKIFQARVIGTGIATTILHS